MAERPTPKPWRDEMSLEERVQYAGIMETFAAMVGQIDENAGRVVECRSGES